MHYNRNPRDNTPKVNTNAKATTATPESEQMVQDEQQALIVVG